MGGREADEMAGRRGRGEGMARVVGGGSEEEGCLLELEALEKIGRAHV